MGLRYTIPFKDSGNNSYEVRIYREGYDGEVKELTGATSCFVVSGTDEDFMYVPLRTSSATINVLDSDLLLDLYSINNQYAPVKLFKNGVLAWTGFIKPEQFTQPYVASVEAVSVECVSAVCTLEHIEYKSISPLGVVWLWPLLKHLINKANGGYRGVYIPWVYGKDASMAENVLEKISLIENNFIKEELNLMEVLEAVCKLLNWTIYDIGGFLYFVDADWRGTYRIYNEALENYTEVQGNSVLIQNVGFNGSNSNTIDIIPGFNKASVKAMNHIFDDVVKDEAFDILQKYWKDAEFVQPYKGADGAHAVRKQFLKPMLWETYAYDSTGVVLNQSVLDERTPIELNNTYGCLLMREADYKCVDTRDPTPAEDVTDFNYEDVVQIRVAQQSTAQPPISVLLLPALRMKGETAVFADCAISIDGTFEAYFDDEMAGPAEKVSRLTRNITAVVSCDGRYYDGSAWIDTYASFQIEVDEFGKIKSNRTPFTPYKDISGYVIPMDFFVGSPEFSILCPVWLDENGTHYNTGVKIKGLKFGYAKKEGIIEEGEDGDRVYENVVNEAYMSKADEIEFDISSYNADGASYSKALLDGGWLTDNLYCKVVDKLIRPEELMIRRIVNRYGETKIKLTEALCMTDEITPITILTERSMEGKTFRLTSGEWDYERGRLAVQIQEDVK